ncbi:MAG: tRNA pseudouridine(54/55) synthase Pus10 [Candidatus Caldarchaeum sp.]|uniref:tRNA pseudouridine synthase Pus10 n=1 Tax=Caldiarchaeum subterraneum TaxID=311458 RepID=A0A7C5Q6W0_CALS0
METVIQRTVELLSLEPLCDYCLGRQFARLGYGLSNRERGRSLKIALLMEAVKQENQQLIRLLAERGGLDEAVQQLMRENIATEKQPCGLCRGMLSEEKFKEVAERVADHVTQYEFETFLIGATVPADIREKEDRLRSHVGVVEGEDLKNDITRGVGRFFTTITGKRPEYISPDITIIVNLFTNTFKILPNPLFIKGRYLKHSRNLPQSPWRCRKCWGRGCEQCGFTGREYPTSVAELVGEPAKKLFEAQGFKFHAAGREDVDALVEDGGRPFVLELKRPRKRLIPLKEVEKTINSETGGLVEVMLESLASRKDVRTLKLASPKVSKTYVVRALYEKEVDIGQLKEIEEKFRNIVIAQRTPTRVLERRADKVRKKIVYETEAKLVSGREAFFKIRCQGGLYVKELVTGDGGRTSPSFAEVLQQVPLRIELTVVSVEA